MVESPVALASTRQAVYRFLRAALAFPSVEQHAWMREPAFSHSLQALGTAFTLECPTGDLVPATWMDHESRYLACFEVGLPAAPVPLLASHYQDREPVPRILHEHLLFYRRLGMPVPNRSQEPADHLVHQLGFLIHLDDLLVEGRVAGASVLWARRDFLSRHVVRWTGEARRRAREKQLPEVYSTLLAVLHAAVEEDLESVAQMQEDLTLETT